MSFGVAELATTFFSQFEAGGLDIRTRGTMVLSPNGLYKVPSDTVGTKIPNVTGNWSPVGDVQDVQSDGIRRLGDIDVWTIGLILEVPDGPQAEPGYIIVVEIGTYQLYNRKLWSYGRGAMYTGRRMLDQPGQS